MVLMLIYPHYGDVHGVDVSSLGWCWCWVWCWWCWCWCWYILTVAVSPQCPPALSLLTDSARPEMTSLLWSLAELEPDGDPTLVPPLLSTRQPGTLLPRHSPALMSGPSLPHTSLDNLTAPHWHLPTPGTYQVGLCRLTTTLNFLCPTLRVVLLYDLVLQPPTALRLEPGNHDNYIHRLHHPANEKRRGGQDRNQS